MLYEDEGVGEDGICSAVEPSCPECPPGEDSVSSMPACMSEDEPLGDVNVRAVYDPTGCFTSILVGVMSELPTARGAMLKA